MAVQHTVHPRPSLRTFAGRTIAAVAVAVALAGCGAEDGSTDASTDPETTAPQGPPCTEIWIEGEDLPKGYSGCLDEEGTLLKPTIVECSSGQRVVTHEDSWWALRGHRIGHAPDGLKESKEYRRMLRGCRA